MNIYGVKLHLILHEKMGTDWAYLFRKKPNKYLKNWLYHLVMKKNK